VENMWNENDIFQVDRCPGSYLSHSSALQKEQNITIQLVARNLTPALSP